MSRERRVARLTKKKEKTRAKLAYKIQQGINSSLPFEEKLKKGWHNSWPTEDGQEQYCNYYGTCKGCNRDC